MELILVNDGSTDDSWFKITEQKNSFPDSVKGINLTKNYGQHNSLLCGFMTKKPLSRKGSGAFIHTLYFASQKFISFR